MAGENFSWVLRLLPAAILTLAFLWHARGDREAALRKQDAFDKIDDLVEESEWRGESLRQLLASPWVRLADFTEAHDNVRVWVYRVGPDSPWEAKVILPGGKVLYECFNGSGETAGSAISLALDAAQSRRKENDP